MILPPAEIIQTEPATVSRFEALWRAIRAAITSLGRVK